MPSPTTQNRLKGLVLSALDLKSLVDWPEALVEDYLNILDNLILLADTLDIEIDKNIGDQIYSSPAQKNYEKRIDEIERKLLALESPKSYDGIIEDIFKRIQAIPPASSPDLKSLELALASQLYHVPNISPPVAYGSCYGTGIGWSQANAVQNTWYKISDADMADGLLHNASHDGSGKITVYPAGHYLILWSLSGGNGTNDDDTEIAVSVSGTETAVGKEAFQTDKANSFFAKSGHAPLNLAANDYLEISIRTIDANTPTLTVEELELTAILMKT